MTSELIVYSLDLTLTFINLLRFSGLSVKEWLARNMCPWKEAGGVLVNPQVTDFK